MVGQNFSFDHLGKVLKVRVGTLLYLTHALVLYSTVTGHEGTPREPWDAPLQRWLCMALLWLRS